MMNLGAFLYKIGYNSFIPKKETDGILGNSFLEKDY